MKKYTLLLIVLFTLPILSYATDSEQPVESSIEEVTVFRNGAQITRQTTVTLSPGRNEILFKGLTQFVKNRTIQLAGSGDFIILSLTHRQDYLEEHPQGERLKQLMVQRDSLELLIEDKKTERVILERELSILMSNTNLKDDKQNLTVDELKQAMDYFHEKLSDLETQKLAISREITNLQEKLRKLKNQISELNGNTQKNSSVVTAVLQSDSKKQVQLTLTYMVSHAGWSPSYDLRVENIDSPVNFSYKANVHQNTGVDWEDVSLEVSSAVPDRSGVLPQLQPWYLRFYTPQQKALGLSAKISREQPAQAQRRVAQDEASQMAPVQEIQNQTSFSYKIELPYDVPSGDKSLAVEIKNTDIPAEYNYYTVPKRRNQAYLSAKVGDWDQYNLLPGSANLFFENTYVGKSSINPQSVGDTLSFSLGRDESIVTERKKLKEFEEKNFFGSRVRESFAWEISVRNSKSQPVSIEVIDQVPISEHEDIKVDLSEKSGADYDQQTGMLTWQLQLDPGKSESVRFEYEVEYPKGKEMAF